VRRASHCLQFRHPFAEEYTMLPPGIHWGVDSSAKINSPAWRNHKKMTAFEFVTEEMGQMPEFWGRYIGWVANQMTWGEIEYLFHASDGNCRLLVIYNGAYDGPGSLRGNYDAGRADARNAIKIATDLSVPDGIMIWADIEGIWHPTAEWFQGW